MSKGTLTTLDFVISVLREHEKELIVLSEKLTTIIKSASGKGVKKDITAIQAILNELRQQIHTLDQRVMTINNSTTEMLLKQVVSQITLQNQSLNLMIETMKHYPSKQDIAALNTSIDNLNTLVKKLLTRQ